jgi:hypothetical protein
MKKMNIDSLIDILNQCKKDGCVEVLFVVEPMIEGKEVCLTILQHDNSVIVSTKKVI